VNNYPALFIGISIIFGFALLALSIVLLAKDTNAIAKTLEEILRRHR